MNESEFYKFIDREKFDILLYSLAANTMNDFMEILLKTVKLDMLSKEKMPSDDLHDFAYKKLLDLLNHFMVVGNAAAAELSKTKNKEDFEKTLDKYTEALK